MRDRRGRDPGAQPGTRVAVVDDDTVIREGLPHLLPGVRVVLAVSSVEELLAARPETDAVLLDLVLTGTGRTGVRQGAAAVEAVARAGHRTLIYTNERRREVLVGCMAAGARGVVHKAEPLAALAAAVDEVAADRVVITQALVGLAELAERRGGLPSLTPRQREILSARARGEAFRSIAERLFIGKKTAEEHMAVVTAKFADFLRDHSPADLERELGLGPGDLLDHRRLN
ncbi:LuxR C-terminal-related transcriptional regulator [Kitasatospora sp. NPDC004272]